MTKGVVQNVFKHQSYMALSEGSRVLRTKTENPIVLGVWKSYAVRSFPSQQLDLLKT